LAENDSGNSGEHSMSPENDSLSQYFDGLSPDSGKLYPENIQDLSTKSNNSEDTGHTGDKLDYIMDDKKDFSDNRSNSNIHNACINCPRPTDPRIMHNHPFYFCKDHPDFKNINLETIEHHLLYHIDYRQ
jgi:hypothetical protein